MPLPFTGLQGFHWGDGVKVLFLFAKLAGIVVIGNHFGDGNADGFSEVDQ